MISSYSRDKFSTPKKKVQFLWKHVWSVNESSHQIVDTHIRDPRSDTLSTQHPIFVPEWLNVSSHKQIDWPKVDFSFWSSWYEVLRKSFIFSVHWTEVKVILQWLKNAVSDETVWYVHVQINSYRSVLFWSVTKTSQSGQFILVSSF